MSMIKLWVHLVWATKNRQPVLSKTLRTKVYAHMRENAKDKDIYIDFVNGYTDHIHLLISLNPDQCIAKIVQLIKEESAFWINKNNLSKEKFEWQRDYFAVSVSQSGIDKVRDYIRNQEEHHARKTFQQEYDEFMQKYDFDLIRES